MIKYAKVINDNTGLCEVGLGTNIAFYQSIGMTEQDVEQSEIDNNWYLAELCPHKSEEEKTAEREADFKTQFFEVPNFGWYRKVPKGYGSAVESMNVAFNAVSLLQKLPANMLIFYEEPDFTDPEQCTEEWLVEHQIFNEEMTVQQFGQLYMVFMTAWNTEMHEKMSESEE
jgi:hypothetical protein